MDYKKEAAPSDEEGESFLNGNFPSSETNGTSKNNQQYTRDLKSLTDDNEQDYQCGVGSCRPSWLQPTASIKVFTLVLSMVHVFGNMNFTYYTAVISEIEREFGLSSSVSGFIKNIDNIGYLLTVILVSHFLRYANKPRVFSIATAGTSFAILLFAMPHFIYSGSEVDIGNLNLTNVTIEKNFSRYDLCDLDQGTGLHGDKNCNTRSTLRPLNAGALVFFVVSELVQGMFQSPKFALSLTYIDDNAKKQSPLYFGFMFAMRSFSPILGFLLGAWTTSIYVDLTDPGISQKDPRWVGAWWLGFIICGMCSLVWCAPLALFPAKFHEEKKNNQDTIDENKKDSENVPSIKELPKALFRLIKNPVLVCLICAACANFYLMGFSTFTPKYLSNHFGLTPSQASILTGVVSACSFSIGPIVSGKLVSAKTISTEGALRFIMLVNIIAAVGFGVMGMLGCPEQQWSGEITLERNVLDMQCNGNCSCDPYQFTPVCGDDNINYFSPCYAGCTQKLSDAGDTQIFTNCTCTNAGMATVGMCPKDCLHMLIPYIIVMVISKFSASMTVVPYFAVLMRCVSHADKALALGLSGSILMIAAFPAPILFGMVVDASCLLQQSSCTRKGACLLYDLDKFRFNMHIFAASVKAGAVVMYLAAWMIHRRLNKNSEADQPNAERETMKSKEMPMLEKSDKKSLPM